MPSLLRLLHGTELCWLTENNSMNQENQKRSRQSENEQQPGDLSSFNKRDVQRSTETEGAEQEARPEKGIDQNEKADDKAGELRKKEL